MSEQATADRPRPATIFDGFSCPWGGDNASLLELLAVEHARNVTDALLDAHGDRIAARSHGLRDILAAFADQGAAFETVWDPAFGNAHAFLLQPDGDPTPIAAAMALRLGLEAPGDWQAEFDAPHPFSFDRWPLPPARRIAVHSDGEALVVSGEGAAGPFSMAFRRSAGGWIATDGAPPETVGAGDLRFRVLYSGQLPEATGRRLLSADAYAFSTSAATCREDWREACGRAADLIEDAAPEYVDWVSRVTRSLLPVASEPRVFNSGSERFSPGVVCMSDHGLVWPIAEMLVHESSHQYMNLLTCMDPLVTGSDERLYYSPFRRKDRPLFFILAAYHAFGNVLAFYRLARAQGRVPDEEGLPEAFFRREAELEGQLAPLADVLAASGGLTEAGEALWRPLHAHLNREAA